MRDYLLLLKVFYKNQYTKKCDDKGNKRTFSKNAVFFIGVFPLLALFIAMMVFLTLDVHDIKVLALLSTTIVSAVQLLTLFLSLAGILSTLYNGSDIPLLSSLPVRPTAVFFAKFSMLYINALKMSALISAPLLLTVTITFNVVNGWMFYSIYPLVLLILLVAPILPLFIVTILSMPISFIGTYFKGKATLKSVLTIILYMCIMGAYVGVTFYLQSKDTGESDVILTDGVLSSLTSLANVMYPNKVLVNFCYGISAAKNFGISLGITVAMVVVMLLLALLFYRRINVKNVESKGDSESKNTILKQSGVVWSIAKRDFKMIMRNSSLAMSSFANMFLAPIMLVAMYFITINQPGAQEEVAISPLFSEMMSMGFVVMYSMIFLGGANTLAALAFTREGKSFFVSRALPISPKDNIKAKLLLSIIVPAIVLIPIAILSLALFKIDVISTLFLLINSMLVVVGVCGMHMVFDMRKGNQYWNDASELRYSAKTNTYQIISSFVAIIPGIISFALGLILSTLCANLGEVVIKVIFHSVTFVLSGAICIFGLMFLKTFGERYYSSIGEHKPNVNKNKRAKYTDIGGGLLK